jgi:hypothetical protein
VLVAWVAPCVRVRVRVCVCVITKIFTFARKKSTKIFAFFVFFVIVRVRWLQVSKYCTFVGSKYKRLQKAQN